MDKLFFISGKISIYLIWIFFFIGGFKGSFVEGAHTYILFGVCYLSLILSLISCINLGNSFSLGLPNKKTILKTKGLYRFSRNPIYLFFGIFTISCLVLLSNVWFWILGIYGGIMHHRLIFKEEKFLERKFGAKYFEYRESVKRYF